MENIHFIRQYFQPLQPNAGLAADGFLQYQEYLPSKILQPFIHCFWTLTSSEHVQFPYEYHIVADGAVDSIFDGETGESYLSVTATQAFEIPFSDKVQYFGVRFLPATIHYFFQLSLAELAGQTIIINDILKNGFEIIGYQLIEKQTIGAKITKIEAILIQQLANRNYELDARFLQALDAILKTNGNSLIQKEVAAIMSPRQLRRVFEKYTALNPKTFARVVRFQQTLSAMNRTPRQWWGRLFFDFGYYDQAHFIREFKTFYGDTPKSLVFPSK